MRISTQSSTQNESKYFKDRSKKLSITVWTEPQVHNSMDGLQDSVNNCTDVSLRFNIHNCTKQTVYKCKNGSLSTFITKKQEAWGPLQYDEEAGDLHQKDDKEAGEMNKEKAASKSPQKTRKGRGFKLNKAVELAGILQAEAKRSTKKLAEQELECFNKGRLLEELFQILVQL